MNFASVWGFIKMILPTKKIGAWILGIIAAIVALVMGVSNADLKAQFCANEPVNLPALPKLAPPAPVVPVPAPAPAK